MKYIKRLRVFENTQELTQEQIDFLDTVSLGKWVVNPNTGLVDVEGGVRFPDKNEKRLENFLGIKFGKVSDFFVCSNNFITSLEGCPVEVGGFFQCHLNKLTSLEGAPEKVEGPFSAHSNQITTLKGIPREIGGSLRLDHNKLTSLKGFNGSFRGKLDFSKNLLTSLEGSPSVCVGSFDVSNNQLTSLSGGPEVVKGNYFCYKNTQLSSLEGAPLKLLGDFYSDVLHFEISDWNFRSMFDELSKLDPLSRFDIKEYSLILTLPFFDPNYIQREIKKNPGKWVMELKGVWNYEEFRPIRDQLKVSDQFLKDIGDQSGLSDLGF